VGEKTFVSDGDAKVTLALFASDRNNRTTMANGGEGLGI
jgi:hypothetical protein